jgi:hypothetical protein
MAQDINSIPDLDEARLISINLDGQGRYPANDKVMPS